jgi:hypothetical protein
VVCISIPNGLIDGEHRRPAAYPNLGSRDITTPTSVHELMVGNWPLRSLFEADRVFSAAFACHAGPKAGLREITPGKSASVPGSACR